METMDEVFKDFQKRAEKAISPTRKHWKGTEEDDLYAVDIHIYRKPGMGNSIQTILGNKLSIMTATSSYLQTLVDKGVCSLDEIDTMIDSVKEVIKHGKN